MRGMHVLTTPTNDYHQQYTPLVQYCAYVTSWLQKNLVPILDLRRYLQLTIVNRKKLQWPLVSWRWTSLSSVMEQTIATQAETGRNLGRKNVQESVYTR